MIESLETENGASAAEGGFADVIAERIADLDAGRAEVIDAKAALAKAREDLRRKRG